MRKHFNNIALLYHIIIVFTISKGYLVEGQILQKFLGKFQIHELKNITAFARDHEDEFIDLVIKKSEKELNQKLKTSHRELEQAKSRIRKLDTIVQRLYEEIYRHYGTGC